ncbi:hypothetical protein QAD02_003728 [Eretmocerus hayati]|uniref:Uncharacterized protein n=1 Tax=Eretmocerus hayati TaxID=131215 RepID=A0ACC2NQ82_9HYME|nr:hypothetical protein QAD02_003728 [Eretmocerus hayati]
MTPCFRGPIPAPFKRPKERQTHADVCKIPYLLLGPDKTTSADSVLRAALSQGVALSPARERVCVSEGKGCAHCRARKIKYMHGDDGPGCPRIQIAAYDRAHKTAAAAPAALYLPTSFVARLTL